MPSNEQTYVTYQTASKWMWSVVTLGIGMILTVVLAAMNLAGQINQRPTRTEIYSRMDRMEDQIILRISPVAIDEGNRQWQVVYVRTPLTDDEIEHRENTMRLHAVWVANYGQEIADELLHASREGREADGTGSGAGGP